MKLAKISDLKKKLTVAGCAAAVAANQLALSAFAAVDLGTTVETAGTAIKDGLELLVEKTVGVASELVPIGLALFGLSWVVKKVKTFFNKVA